MKVEGNEWADEVAERACDLAETEVQGFREGRIILMDLDHRTQVSWSALVKVQKMEFVRKRREGLQVSSDPRGIAL